MQIVIDYYKKNPDIKGVGTINHITITEDNIIELAKSRVVEDDGYEYNDFVIDKVICGVN